jgi:hypothetical protein
MNFRVFILYDALLQNFCHEKTVLSALKLTQAYTALATLSKHSQHFNLWEYDIFNVLLAVVKLVNFIYLSKMCFSLDIFHRDSSVLAALKSP